jgi:periplasmic protein TonB
MNTSLPSCKTLDDLVFEHRNHLYGAYFLRKEYSKRLSTALVVSISAFAVLLIAPTLFKGEEIATTTLNTATVTMLPPPPIKPLPPIDPIVLPPPPPPPSVKNIFNATLVNRNVETEIPPNDVLNKPSFNIDGPATGVGEYPTDIDFVIGQIGEPAVTKVDTFIVVEKMPEFDGDLSKFLQKNLRYPEAAIIQELEGRVSLSFVIGADGVISGIEVVRGISKECDAEAVRVVSKMPKWKPGKQSGRAVPVRFSLPINFKMNH